MEEVISNEIDDMLAKGIIERSKAAYASPLVLVKKPVGTYRTCVNFKELNKIAVFDPEPMMSANDIFFRSWLEVVIVCFYETCYNICHD